MVGSKGLSTVPLRRARYQHAGPQMLCRHGNRPFGLLTVVELLYDPVGLLELPKARLSASCSFCKVDWL